MRAGRAVLWQIPQMNNSPPLPCPQGDVKKWKKRHSCCFPLTLVQWKVKLPAVEINGVCLLSQTSTQTPQLILNPYFTFFHSSPNAIHLQSCKTEGKLCLSVWLFWDMLFAETSILNVRKHPIDKETLTKSTCHIQVKRNCHPFTVRKNWTGGKSWVKYLIVC